MANVGKRLSTNVEGHIFVDHTCINCDTCQQLAPSTFQEVGEFSSVSHQPQNPTETSKLLNHCWRVPLDQLGR